MQPDQPEERQRAPRFLSPAEARAMFAQRVSDEARPWTVELGTYRPVDDDGGHAPEVDEASGLFVTREAAEEHAAQLALSGAAALRVPGEGRGRVEHDGRGEYVTMTETGAPVGLYRVRRAPRDYATTYGAEALADLARARITTATAEAQGASA